VKIKSLHILLVSAWYPDETHHTNGSFVEEQAIMLKRFGHSVTVLHPYLLGNFTSAFFKRKLELFQTRNGIQVLHVGVKPVLPGFRNLAYRKLYLTCLKALEKYNINLDDFDIMHSHALFMGGYIAMKLAQKTGKIFFHTEHTSGLIYNPSQYNPSDRKIIESVYISAKKVFFVSNYALSKTLEQYGIKEKDKFTVIPNVVDNSFFDCSIDTLQDEKFNYIVIGNLITRKQVDLLLFAWKRLLLTFPNSSLTIAGEGPERNKLVKISASLEINNSIVFLPKLSRSEVKEHIQRHQALVSVSALETFGLTVAEAQAMGKPVLVTNSGGVREIVNQNTGILVENSLESIVLGLISLQEKYSKFDSIYIRQETKKKFSEKTIYLKLIQNYKYVYK
jgi:glycosyltransferase involved in cell wall biosynthesis